MVFMPTCANMLKNHPASCDQGCSTAMQPRQPPCVEARPPPPFQPFLLAQNFSSKGLHQLITTAKVRRQKALSVIKGLNMWPTVCKLPIPLIEQLQLLQYYKFQMALVTTNYGDKETEQCLCFALRLILV